MTARLAGLIVALALAAGPSLAQEAIEPNVDVVGADFGVFTMGADGAPSFRPARVISLEAKEDYGWLMMVRSRTPVVHFREEFTLPAAAPNWNVQPGDGTTVSADGRSAITEQDVRPQGGAIFHFWSVAPDDPKGHYVMKVIVDGAIERRFEFDVR